MSGVCCLPPKLTTRFEGEGLSSFNCFENFCCSTFDGAYSEIVVHSGDGYQTKKEFFCLYKFLAWFNPLTYLGLIMRYFSSEHETKYNQWQISFQPPTITPTISSQGQTVLSPESQNVQDRLNTAISQAQSVLTPVSQNLEDRLNSAIRQGNNEELRRLIEEGVDLNATCGQYSNRPLEVAIYSDNLYATKLLLESGADMTICNRWGDTLWSYAATHNRVEHIKLLFQKAENLGIKEKIISEIIDSFLYSLRMIPFLRAGLDPNSRSESGDTLLHVAAILSGSAFLKELLEKDVALDVLDSNGRSPLNRALRFNRIENAKLLLAKGANPNISDNGGFSPLQIANSNKELVELLFSKGALPNLPNSRGVTPFSYAIGSGKEDLVELYLNNGALVNEPCEEIAFPLHVAAVGDNVKVVELLLSNGAGLYVRNSMGSTPLHLAAANGRVENIRKLMESGAEHNLENYEGRLPIHSAARSGKEKAVEALLDEKVNVDATDRANCTALFYSIFEGKESCLALLVERGANVNHQNNRGETALHLAAQFNKYKAMKLLLDKGAKAEAKNKEGQTPLDLLKKSKGYEEGSEDSKRCLELLQNAN